MYESISQIESTPKGIFEILVNGLWPSEETLEQAEQERLERLRAIEIQ